MNLLEYNGINYVHDVYNQDFYEFTSGLVLKKYCIKDDNQTVLLYKPSADIIYNNKTRTDIIKRIEIFNEDSLKSHLNKKELIEIIKETDNIYFNNIDMFCDLHETVKPYIKKILP